MACAATLSKSTSQRLLNWRTFMSEFSYVIRHIPGAENHWGDFLSRLRSVGGGAADSGEEVPVYVRSIAVVAPTDADYSFPSMGEIRDRQDIYTDGKAVLDSPLGSVVRGENGLYRVDYGGMQVIWVPPAERSLQVRLMVCAHMQEAGHRGICATMHRLGAYCVWEGMKEDVTEFVQQCLHCVDSRAGNVVPRPLGEILHGTEVGEVLHFDYLKLGDNDDRYAYVLVLVDDVSSFVSLQLTASCTSEVAARSILEWVSVLGTPEVFVSDGAPYFKNETLKLVAAKLGASHRFSVAYSSWSNGTVERMNLEVVRTFRAVMSERGRPLSEWPDSIYAVQFALNSAYRERMGATPFQLMTGRVPRTAFSVLAGDGPDGWCVKEEEFSPELMQKSVAGWVSVQEELRRKVLERVRAARGRKRVAASTGSMPNFEVGDYVLVARVRKLGSAPKLVTTWTGPWRVVSGGSPHVYNVQDIVTGETKEVHVVRMRAYADSSLAVGAEVKGLFEMTKHQGEYEIQDILNIGEGPLNAGDYKVQVAWVGLYDEDPTWEPVEVMFKDVPKLLVRKLKQMRLPKRVRNALRQRYGMKV